MDSIGVETAEEIRLGRLRKLGLSASAAKTYAALLELGTADAREVARLAGLPVTKVYDPLEQLQERGLVEVLAETPRRYTPVPIAYYLRDLRQQHEDRIREILTSEEDLAALFPVRGLATMDDRGTALVLRGRRSSVAKFRQLMRDAREEVFLMGATGMTRRLPVVEEALRSAKARGVRVRLLAHATMDTLDRLDELSAYAHMRANDMGVHEAAHVSVLVVDHAAALLTRFIPDDGSLRVGHDVSLFTNQESIVAALHALVESRWEKAAEFQLRRRELLQGRRPLFTRIYSNEQEMCDAIMALFKPGVQEYRRANSEGAPPPTPDFLERMKMLEGSGGRGRHLLNFPDKATAKAYLELREAFPHQEFRHHDPGVYVRFVVVDQEAVFSVSRLHPDSPPAQGSPSPGRDYVVHTNHEGAVDTLVQEFERLWSRGAPLSTFLGGPGPSEVPSRALTQTG